MRITTRQQYLNSITNMQSSQNKLANLQEQIATGKKLQKPSDDPVAAAQVVKLDRELAQLDKFNDNIEVTSRRLELEETILEDINNATIRVRELTVLAGNGVLADADRKSIATEMDQLVDYMAGLMNTKDAQGEYLFAGSRGFTQPYQKTADGSYDYKGDNNSRNIQVAPELYVSAGDSGEYLFQAVSMDGVTRVIPNEKVGNFDFTSNMEIQDEEAFRKLVTTSGEITVSMYIDDPDPLFPGVPTYGYRIQDSAGVDLVAATNIGDLSTAKNIIYQGLSFDIGSAPAATVFDFETTSSVNGMVDVQVTDQDAARATLAKYDDLSVIFNGGAARLTGTPLQVATGIDFSTSGLNFNLTTTDAGAVNITINGDYTDDTVGGGLGSGNAALLADINGQLAGAAAGVTAELDEWDRLVFTENAPLAGDTISFADNNGAIDAASLFGLSGTAASNTGGTLAYTLTDRAGNRVEIDRQNSWSYTDGGSLSIGGYQLDLATPDVGGIYKIRNPLLEIGSHTDTTITNLTDFSAFSSVEGDLSLDFDTAAGSYTLSSATTGLLGTFNIPAANADGTYTISLGTGATSGLPADELTTGMQVTMSADLQDGETLSITLPPKAEITVRGEQPHRNILDVVQELTTALKMPKLEVDTQASGDADKKNMLEVLASTLTEIDSVIGRNLEARTAIGSRMNSLESVELSNQDFKLFTQTALSNFEDTDLAEAISYLQLEQVTLQAAQATFAKVQKLSLFDYLN